MAEGVGFEPTEEATNPFSRFQGECLNPLEPTFRYFHVQVDESTCS